MRVHNGLRLASRNIPSSCSAGNALITKCNLHSFDITEGVLRGPEETQQYKKKQSCGQAAVAT